MGKKRGRIMVAIWTTRADLEAGTILIPPKLPTSKRCFIYCQTLFNSLPVQHDDQTIIVSIPLSSRVPKHKSRSLAPQKWRRLKLSRRDRGLVSVAQKINLMTSPLPDMRLANQG